MKKRSDQLKAFIDFIEESKREYLGAIELIKIEDKRQEDLVHDFENAKDYRTRCKLGTPLHKCRNDRRKYKDTLEETSWIYNFVMDPQNKKVFDKFSQLLGNVRRSEKLHEEWVYKRRLKDGE